MSRANVHLRPQNTEFGQLWYFIPWSGPLPLGITHPIFLPLTEGTTTITTTTPQALPDSRGTSFPNAASTSTTTPTTTTTQPLISGSRNATTTTTKPANTPNTHTPLADGSYRIRCETQHGGRVCIEAFPFSSVCRPKPEQRGNLDQRWQLAKYVSTDFRC